MHLTLFTLLKNISSNTGLKSFIDDFYNPLNYPPNSIQHIENIHNSVDSYILYEEQNENANPTIITLYLKDYIELQFDIAKSVLGEELNKILFECSSLELAIHKLSVIKLQTIEYISHIKKLDDSNAKKIVENCLKKLDVIFDEKSNQLQSIYSKYINNITKRYEIKWLGNINKLAQLFMDLLKGQDGGKQYIEIDHELLKKFIKENFVDKTGKKFLDNTIDQYFMYDDQENKRAKSNKRFIFPKA